MLRTILFLGFFLPSSLAFSITMTFDSIWESLAPNTPGRYTENGITASDSSPICNHCPSIYGWLGGPMGDPSPEVLHLDDAGNPYSTGVSFTTGNTFDAVSLDIPWYSPSNLDYQLINPQNSSEINASNVPYDNVLILGYSGGSLVAEDSFSIFDRVNRGDVYTHLFDASYSGIDELIVRAVQPDFVSIEAALLSEFPGYNVEELACGYNPAGNTCSSFELDNLVLNPVPVPAAAWLFGSALLGFFGFSRRKASA